MAQPPRILVESAWQPPCVCLDYLRRHYFSGQEIGRIVIGLATEPTVFTILERRLGDHATNRVVHPPRRTHVRLPEIRAKLTWRVNLSIRFDTIRRTWNLGIAWPSRWRLRPMAVAGSSSARTAPLRSLPNTRVLN